MKKYLLFILLLTQYNVSGQFNWIQKDSLPSSPRFFGSAFVIGDIAYAGLGATDAEQRIYSSEFFKYDPAGDNWTQLPDFPGRGLYAASAFTVNGKGYICLGVDTDLMWRNEVWEFNPVTESWTQKSDFPGGDRYSCAAFVIDNKAYIVGGSVNQGQNYLNELWCYTPATDSWVQKASLPTEHKSGPVAFSINGKGYAVGGAYSTMEPTLDFYEYNPSTNAWTRLQDYPGARTAALGFVIGNTAYVGTGTNLNSTYKTFWSFTPSSNVWTAAPTPPADFGVRVAGTGFSIGSSGYVFAGRSEPYDPFYTNGKLYKDLWAFTTCQTPVAGFGYLTNNFEVSFSDSSSGATQYHWNFGDGTSSNEKDPVHTFTPGFYKVCHTVTSECGADSICKTIQIACPPPEARIFAAYYYPDAQFNDSSLYGTLISRLWDFGDSTYSGDPNPVHTYSAPGIYHVCLTITDSCGTSTACEDIYLLIPMTLQIAITPAVTNDLLAQFTDLTPATTNWKWKFGDGDSSALQNPSHLYKEYGIYQVCLTAWNSQYLGTYCDYLPMLVNPALHTNNPVLVYPNPTDGKLFLRFYKNCASTNVVVEDQTGMRVFMQQISDPDLTAPAKIDLTRLSKGLYYVHVNCDSYKKVWKIIIP